MAIVLARFEFGASVWKLFALFCCSKNFEHDLRTRFCLPWKAHYYSSNVIRFKNAFLLYALLAVWLFISHFAFFLPRYEKYFLPLHTNLR